ncbi:ABC transporter permease [Actinoalloteichus sp. AHMU CJ021]|uniref:Transport permease protein n=1 Tax=Actinoalloteichus caeruleus DSM 43889 TaxID=1120930 RepID=A0ABT1JIS2_ACTCY|nr:ABC transporter permease [Actinoalloteichus caeruleus]AUS78344.1 ABC transporter permease [Actinoalloteichus sp. AHMU CJ021]MCP2332421.1 ABC-2 type transport system permease protein [Actinoalloteichus caeruleus DSM 43889]
MNAQTIEHVHAADEDGTGGRIGRFLSDTRAVFTREIVVVLRDPFSLVFSLLQPLVFLALFAPLLGGMVGGDGIGDASALEWFLPGVIVMICVFGTGMTGSNLQYEMQTGSYERILASPLSRASILTGRALKEFAPLVVQALVITLVAVPLGVTPHLAHVLVGILLLGVFGIGLGALSYALAIATRGKEWMFWTVQQSLTFPLLLLSGMMLPLETGPDWMRTVARFNPLTYIVDAERELFMGTFASSTVLWGAVAAALTCAGGLAVGIRTIRRSAR